MQGLTHAELAGTIARETELRYTSAATAILEATIAGADTPPGADRAFPWYHRAVLLGAFAEALADRLTPGTAVYATGRIEARTWDRPDGGTGRAVTVIPAAMKVLEEPTPDQLDTDQAGQPRLRDGWNHALVMGNLTHDANLHDTNTGRKVAKLRVAVNERTGKGEQRTSFLSARAWDDLALDAAHLAKGAPVVLTGRLVAESWTTRDGERRSDTKIEAHRIDRVATPPARPVAAPRAPADTYDEAPPEDALPF